MVLKLKECGILICPEDYDIKEAGKAELIKAIKNLLSTAIPKVINSFSNKKQSNLEIKNYSKIDCKFTNKFRNVATCFEK